MLPWARAHFQGSFCFQHDKDPAHRAWRVTNFMNQASLSCFPNPIEHMCGALQRAVDSRDVRPDDLRELGQVVQEEWQNLPLNTLQTRVNIMPSRPKAARWAHGGYTHYWRVTRPGQYIHSMHSNIFIWKIYKIISKLIFLVMHQMQQQSYIISFVQHGCQIAFSIHFLGKMTKFDMT